ncbi:MAG TPA: hypothetical protein VGC41_10935 [Kofleriaceae bacterium]
MGDFRELEEQQAERTKHVRKDVDTESEHDGSRSRTHSNASLRRVADAGGKKADPTALHEKSSRKTYDSVKDGMILLAKEMHVAMPALDEAQRDDPEHNNAIGLGSIEQLFHILSADTANLKAMLATVAPSEISTLGTEIKTLWGAWFLCSGHLNRALSWYRTQQGGQQMSISNIEDDIKAMIAKFGTTPADLGQIRKEPEGDSGEMANAQISEEIGAANAALDSMQAGNAGDGARAKSAIQHLGVRAGYSRAIGQHKKELVALQARVEGLRAKDPSNKDLSDAAFHLAVALKKK